MPSSIGAAFCLLLDKPLFEATLARIALLLGMLGFQPRTGTATEVARFRRASSDWRESPAVASTCNKLDVTTWRREHASLHGDDRHTHVFERFKPCGCTCEIFDRQQLRAAPGHILSRIATPAMIEVARTSSTLSRWWRCSTEDFTPSRNKTLFLYETIR